jgi:hypothetical protein
MDEIQVISSDQKCLGQQAQQMAHHHYKQQDTMSHPVIGLIIDNMTEQAIAPNLDSATLHDISLLDAATKKIDTSVRMLHYPEQQAILKDNTLCYLKTLTYFYYENKSLFY